MSTRSLIRSTTKSGKSHPKKSKPTSSLAQFIGFVMTMALLTPGIIHLFSH